MRTTKSRTASSLSRHVSLHSSPKTDVSGLLQRRQRVQNRQYGKRGYKRRAFRLVGEHAGAVFATFRMQVCLRELVYHLLLPLGVLMVAVTEGRWGLRNRYFLRFDSLLGLRRWLVALAEWSAVATANVLFFTFDLNSHGISPFELLVINLLFVTNTLIICAKYGYLSDGEWQQFTSTLLTKEDQQSRSLLSGWILPSALTVRQEIDLAIERSGVHVEPPVLGEPSGDLSYFTFDPASSGHPRIKATFSGLLACVQADDTRAAYEHMLDRGEVHVNLMLYKIVVDAIEQLFRKPVGSPWRTASHIRLTAAVLSVVHAVLPGIVRVVSGDSFLGGSDAAAVFSTLYLATASYFLWLNIMYGFAGACDFKRRRLMMERVATLLGKRKDTAMLEPLPLLQVIDPHNVLIWYNCRAVLRHVGLRFFKRIEVIFSLFVVVAVIIIGLFLYSALSGDVDSVAVVSSTAEALALVCCVVYMTLLAQRVNGSEAEQRVHLAKFISVLGRPDYYARDHDSMPAPPRDKIACVTFAPGSEAWKDQLQKSVQIMETVATLLKFEQPVKILGFEASTALLRGLITVFAAVLAVIAQSVS